MDPLIQAEITKALNNRNKNRNTQRLNDKTCPIKGCSHTLTGNRGDRIKHILTHTHKEVCTLDVRNMAHIHKLHMCRHCKTTPSIFCSTISLNKHIEAKHPMQSDNADEFMLTFFPKSETQRVGKWGEALTFLQTLDMQPTPHRTSLFNHNMHHTWREAITREYERLSSALCATIAAKHNNYNDTETDENGNTNVNNDMLKKAYLPLWKLFFIFESIVLAPPSERDKINGNKSYRRLIPERIGQLQAGHVKALYQNAYCHTPTPPNERTNKNKTENMVRRSSAAARAENHSLAIRRLQNLPIAKNTTENIRCVTEKYFPDKCSYKADTPTLAHEPPDSQAIKKLTGDDEVFMTTLMGLKKGTANGPLADSIDLLRYAGLKNNKFRHNLLMLVNQISTGCLPTELTQFFNANFFFALHKDKDDTSNLRPIGIATALRRVTSTHLSNCSSPYAAALMAPIQMGIGISGGLDFITMTARMRAERHIHKKYERTMIFLDLTNQFNNASRAKLEELLTLHFPCLLGYFNSTYSTTNKCWYEKPDGGWDYILQKEGVTQGDPLSGLLSSLVLHSIMHTMKLELDWRADTRLRQGNLGDDGQGSKTYPQSYLDDTNIIAPHIDLEFIMNYLTHNGPKIGVILSQNKNQFITALNGEDPREHSAIFRAYAPTISKIINSFGSKKGELRRGGTLLGQPIGPKSLVDSTTKKVVKEMSIISQYLEHIDYDPHVALKLFRTTILQKATHLFAADILSTDIPDEGWPTTRFQKDLKNIVCRFIQKLTGTSTSLPPHSYAIATLPVAKGGYGFMDPLVTSVPSFLAPIARAIKTITKNGLFIPSRGLLLDMDRLDLTPPARFNIDGYQIWTEWESEKSHIFHCFRRYADRFVAIPPKFAADNPEISRQQFLTECETNRELPKMKQHHHHAHFQAFTNTLEPSIREAIPKRLNKFTSIAVTGVTTSHSPYVIKPDLLNISLRRKLLLPLYDGPLIKCVCGTTIDRMGEHYFQCRHLSKTPMHNTCRDALTDIVKGLSQYIGIDTPEVDITREQEGLLTSTPTIRPGDFSIINGDSRSRLSMIHTDCTCHGVSKNQSVHSIVSDSQIAQYERTENIKFDFYHRGGQQRAGLAELNRKQHGLIPFVFDQYGNLGPFAERFLLGKRVRGSDQRDVTGLPREESRRLLDRSASDYCMHNILSHANCNFLKDSSAPNTFSPIVNARMPSDWAIQHLSVNLTHAFACHIRRSQKICYKRLAKKQNLGNFSLYPADHYQKKGYSLQSLNTTANPVLDSEET